MLTLYGKNVREGILAKWEKTRDVGQEILQGIRDIKASRSGRRFTAESYPIVRAREKSGLSQAKFAELHPAVLRKIAA